MVTYMKMYGYKINDNVSNACLKNLKYESILSKDFKGVRWMPWRYQPKKDAVSCDKLRRDASNL